MWKRESITDAKHWMIKDDVNIKINEIHANHEYCVLDKVYIHITLLPHIKGNLKVILQKLRPSSITSLGVVYELDDYDENLEIITEKIISFRAREIGDYEVYIISDDVSYYQQLLSPTSVTSSSMQLTIGICDDKFTQILPSLMEYTQSNINQDPFVVIEASPKVELSFRGALPSGSEHLTTIQHKDLPQKINTGTWSISFWLLYQDPDTNTKSNTEFYNLFYKGSGYDDQRTPSCWLNTATRRLTLRISTTTNPDTNADSQIPIPKGVWNMLTFTFENATSSSTSTDVGYSISLYINGSLDIMGTTADPALMNEHALHLFGEASHTGPLNGLVADVTIWDNPMSDIDIIGLYSKGLSPHVPVDSAALDFLKPNQNHHEINNNYNNLLSSSLSLDADLEVEVEVDVDTTANAIDIEQERASALLQEAATLRVDCDGTHHELKQSIALRLELYHRAVLSNDADSIQALHLWGMLLVYGSEDGATKCGMSEFSGWLKESTGTEFSQFRGMELERGVIAITLAASLGYRPSLLPLSSILRHGIGTSVLLYADVPDCITLAKVFKIPYPYSSSSSSSDSSSNIDNNDNSNEDINSNRSGGGSSISSRPEDQLLLGLLSRISHLCLYQQQQQQQQSSKNKVLFEECYVSMQRLADDLLHVAAAHRDAGASMHLMQFYQKLTIEVRVKTSATGLQSESYGQKLVNAYTETAARYAWQAVKEASISYHTIGSQPIVEADRLSDLTSATINQGKSGENDEMIQMQLVRAEEGDIPSIVATADLYYYGARGLPRDHVKARSMFLRAADLGDVIAANGIGNMMLKGEGGPKNITGAIKYYEHAAAENHLNALNGLGFIYFYGQSEDYSDSNGNPIIYAKNQTKAFEYFKRAVDHNTDGDSYFNLGYIYESGSGISKNNDLARLYYGKGVKIGHFDSICAFGRMAAEGTGTTRSAKDALYYLNHVAELGPWHGWIRRGLDIYLTAQTSSSSVASSSDNDAIQFRLYRMALMNYLFAPFPIANGNAAYLLRRRLQSNSLLTNIPKSVYNILQESNVVRIINKVDVNNNHCSVPQIAGSLGLLELSLLNKCSAGGCGHGIGGGGDSVYHLLMGDVLWHGRSDLHPDRFRALDMYSKASLKGNALASLYCGMLYHMELDIHLSSSIDAIGSSKDKESTVGFHLDFDRATRYYDLSISQLNDTTSMNPAQALSLVFTHWKMDPDSANVQMTATVLMVATALRFLLKNRSLALIYPLAWIANKIGEYTWN